MSVSLRFGQMDLRLPVFRGDEVSAADRNTRPRAAEPVLHGCLGKTVSRRVSSPFAIMSFGAASGTKLRARHGNQKPRAIPSGISYAHNGGMRSTEPDRRNIL